MKISGSHIATLVVGLLLGWVLASGGSAPSAQAASCPVDQSQLEKIYSGIFHRELDSGALGYVGYDLSFVIDELLKSEEHDFYTNIFTAAKNLENAHRDGTTSTIDTHYTDLSTALGNLETWASGSTVSAPTVGGSTGTTTEEPAEVISPRTATAILRPEAAIYIENVNDPVKFAELEIEMLCPTAGKIQLRSISFDADGSAAQFLTDVSIGGYSGIDIDSSGNRWTLSGLEVYQPTQVCGDFILEFFLDSIPANSTWFMDNLTLTLPEGAVQLYERREDVSPSDPIYYRWERMLVNGS